MSMTRRQVLTSGLLTSGLAAGTALTIPAAVAGCGSSRKPARKLRTLRYTPGYVGAREFCVYVGRRLGFFAKRGIDLVINQGGPSVSLSSVIEGQADMADADFASIAQTFAPANGTDPKTDFRAVMVVNKQMMFALFSYAAAKINSPVDLEGKVIGCANGSAVQRLWPTYCKQVGINPAKSRFYTVPAAQTGTMLSAHEVDVFGTYVTDRAIVAKNAGGPSRPLNKKPLLYSDRLVDPYGTLVLASEKLCNDHDKSFVHDACEAIRESIAYCLSNPTGAARLLAKEVPTQQADISAAVYTDMRNYISPGPAFDYSHMIKALSLLAGAGMIAPGVTPEKLVYNVFPAAESQA